MPNNVVELVVRTLDEATPGLKAIGGALDTLKTTAVAFGAYEIFKTFIDNTIEAENALVRLQAAVRNSTELAYASSEDLVKFAEETSRSSIFSKAAIENAETSLLRFSHVAGPVFEQARKAALNLASALGRDLADTAFQVGRALENPAQGLRLLAAAGVVFSPAQRAMITELVKTGEAARAQQIILEAINATYRDSADVASNTLGGALKRLGNAFAELFKSDTPGPLTKALGALADGINAINTAAEKLKKSEGFKGITALAIKGSESRITEQQYAELLGGPKPPPPLPTAKPIAGIEDKLGASYKLLDQEVADRRARLSASLEEFKPGSRAAGFTIGLTTDQLNAQVAAAETSMKKFTDAIDMQHTSVGKTKDAMKDLYESWDKETETAAEKTIAAYHDMETKAKELLNAPAGTPGKISPEEYNKRISEATDTALEFTSVLDLSGKQVGYVFDTAAIGLKKMKVPLSELEVGIHNFVADFSSALGNLATRGGLSMRNLLADFARMLADRAIFRAIEEIGKAFEKALTPKAGAGGGTGWLGTVATFIGALYGKAGGGDFSGLTIVGEEGPELVAGRGTVMNRRQLQFALGNAPAAAGQAVHYAPQTNIVVQGNADEKTLKYVEARLAQGWKDQRNWLSDTLYRNGYQRLR